MTQRSYLPAAAAALLAAAAVVLLSHRFGSRALGIPLLLVGTGLLLDRAAVAMTVAVGAVIVIEADPGWGPSAAPAHLYQYLPGARITGDELFVAIALAAAVLLTASGKRTVVLPRPFSGPLGVLALGLVAGAVTGHDAGVGVKTIVDAGRSAALLIVMPFIVVQVIHGRAAVRRALGVGAALATFKGIAGVIALVLGLTSVAVGSHPITYYDAPANALMLAFLLVVAAAAVMRVPLPRWVWVGTPFVTAALLLSYRRSFWIATVLGLLFVVLLGSGRTLRSFGFPLAIAFVIAVYLAVGSTAVSQLDTRSADPGSLSGRLASLNPSSLQSNIEDRYRIDERRNVLADLQASPIAGLGLGVGWIQHSPLSIGNITRQYVHVGALWWWMKLGILGLIGYLWILGRAVVTGLQIWRRHPDRLIRAAGLGAAATTVGFAVAELTATFAGPDPRMSIIVGAFIGLLAVGHGQLSAVVSEPEAGPQYRARGPVADQG